jgi:hypothetical protein
MVTLTISYGYDIHSIEMDAVTFAAIKSGRRVTLEGQGFTHEEDGEVLDHWVFNDSPGAIFFWLDNGAEFRAENSWVEET